jgi:hypothetical protein
MKQDQQQLERVLNNMKRLTPVEPSFFLYAKIQHKIAERTKARPVLSGKLIWKMAGVFTLLVALNVSALYTYPSETATDQTVSTTDVLGMNTDNYYETNY